MTTRQCFKPFFVLNLSLLIFVLPVFAAKHVAKCVPAYVKQETTITCAYDNYGLCRGSWIYAEKAIHGYCDTNEAGVCFDASEVEDKILRQSGTG